MKGGRGKNLPDEDHIIRYVPWQRLRRDQDDNVIGFLPHAFELREGEEYLSVNWLEFYEGSKDEQFRLSIWTIRDRFEKPLGKRSAFAIGNVGKVRQTCRAAGNRVRIVHEPQAGNPG